MDHIPIHWFGFEKENFYKDTYFQKERKPFQAYYFFSREQKVRARRNNKEMLKHEIQFMSSYHNVSRVKTSKVAEGE